MIRRLTTFLSAPKVRSRLWLLPLVVLAAFLLGLWLFFPAPAIQQRLNLELSRLQQPTIEVGEIRAIFPLGLAAESLELATASHRLHFESLQLTPLWSSLWRGNAALHLDSRLLGGELNATVTRHGHFALHAQQVQFDEAMANSSALRIQGNLSQLELRGSSQPQLRVEDAQLECQQLVLRGLKNAGMATDTLALGIVRISARQDGRQLIIEQLTAQGGDIAVDGKGTLTLATPLERSRINLMLTLKPGAGLDQDIHSLLQLVTKPTANGVYPLKISGTLAQPKLQ